MKVVIIGLGSIGKKHLSVLNQIDPKLECFALRSGKGKVPSDGIKNISSWSEIPRDVDFIIISNPTHLHFATLKEAIKLNKPIFLEKPPFLKIEEVYNFIQEFEGQNIPVFVAFNLRFHPVINWIKENVSQAEILEVTSYCGSYLPDWRPSGDYRNNYSAIKRMGGGVHLDLIHEIDYLAFLFGAPINSKGFVAKVSDLEIDSMDAAHYWIKFQNFNSSVTLNYFRRQPKRTLEIVTKNDVIKANLITSTVMNKDGKVLFETKLDQLYTYRSQMEFFTKHLAEKNYDKIDTLENSLISLKTALDVIEA